LELQDAFQSVSDAYLDYCSSKSIRAEKPSSFPDVLSTKLCKPYDPVDFLESEEELKKRRREFKPLPPKEVKGFLAKYAKTVQSASVGAVTL